LQNECWIAFEFDSDVALNQIEVQTMSSQPDGYFSFELWTSGATNDGTYSTRVQVAPRDAGTFSNAYVSSHDPAPSSTHYIEVDSSITSSKQWKLRHVRAFKDNDDAGYPSIADIKFRTKSEPWFYVELPHTVVNPLVTIVTSSSMGARDATSLEMWIGPDEGENKESGRHAWKQPSSSVKCGTLSSLPNKYPIMSSTCEGTGKGVFFRPVDGASLSIVATEIRVSIVRAHSLGVWCVPTQENAVAWHVAMDAESHQDWSVRGDAIQAPFATAQQGINRADNGDIVVLGSGVFRSKATETATSSSPCELNMLRDSSFEGGLDEDWTGGQRVSGGYSGMYARESSFGPGVNSLFKYKHPILLVPGSTYVLSAYIKVTATDGPSTSNLFYLRMGQIYADKEREGNIFSNLYLTSIQKGTDSADTDWTYQSVVFVAPFVDAQWVYCNLGWYSFGPHRTDGTSATVLTDDMSLQLLDGHAGATKRRCNHNLDLLGKAITIRGVSAEKTIIECGRADTTETSLTSSIASRGFLFVSGEGRDTVVEHLTVRHCHSAHSSITVDGYVDDLKYAGLSVNKAGAVASNMFGSAVVIRVAAPSLRHVHLTNNRAKYGGSVTIQGTCVSNTPEAMFTNVTITNSIADAYAGAVFIYCAALKWKGGSARDCRSAHGGSVLRLALAQKVSLSEITFERNINSFPNIDQFGTKWGGYGAIWMVENSGSPIIELRDNFFRDNVDFAAKDLFIAADVYPFVALINNIHADSKSDSDVTSSSSSVVVPSVLISLKSCNQVSTLFRSRSSQSNVFVLERKSSMYMSMRCDFIPAASGSQQDVADITTMTTEFYLDGWNMILRREWQDGNGFEKSWNEYAKGFGQLSTAFVTGLHIVSEMTQSQEHQLRLDVCSLSAQIDNAIELVVPGWSLWGLQNNKALTITMLEDEAKVKVVGTVVARRGVLSAGEIGDVCQSDCDPTGTRAGICGPYLICFSRSGGLPLAVPGCSFGNIANHGVENDHMDYCVAEGGSFRHFSSSKMNMLALMNRCPNCRLRLRIVGDTVDSRLSIFFNQIIDGKVTSLEPVKGQASLPSTGPFDVLLEYQPHRNIAVSTSFTIEIGILLFPDTAITLSSVQMWSINECLEATWSKFAIAAEEANFQLSRSSADVNRYFTTVQTSDEYTSGPVLTVNSLFPEQSFTTYDRDNDIHGGVNCADSYSRGGWWYQACHSGHLTGKYPDINSINVNYGNSVGIRFFLGHYSSLSMAEMKIKSASSTRGVLESATCSRSSCSGRCINRPPPSAQQHLGVWCLEMEHLKVREL
jgi:hypothetical protein